MTKAVVPAGMVNEFGTTAFVEVDEDAQENFL